MTSTELSDPRVFAQKRDFATIVIPPAQMLLDKIKADIDEARDFDVCSPEMAEIAQEMAGRIATVQESLDEQRLATTKPLRDGAQWVNEGFNLTIASLDAIVKSLKAKLAAWNKKVADEKREAERLIAIERQKVADAAAEVARKQKEEADKLLRQAEEATAAGNTEAANDLFTQASVTADAARETQTAAAQQLVAPVRTAVASSGVKGASVTWKARVTDKALLIKAAAEDASLHAMLDVNESNLGAFARLHKGIMHMPGVEFYSEDTTQRIAKRSVT